jgi:hypothetical protein
LPLSLLACDPGPSQGIGTSPSGQADDVDDTEADLKVPPDFCLPTPCGLWYGASGLDEAYARHTESPALPDLEQFTRIDGLSCSHLLQIAASPPYAGHSVVYYVER